MKINAIYPAEIKKYGIPDAISSITEAMEDAGADVSMHCLTVDKNIRKTFYQLSVHPAFKSVAYRLFSADVLKRYTEKRYLNAFREGDVGYISPGVSYYVINHLKTKGHTLCIESVNTHTSTSKLILDTEYKRLGLQPTHGISDVTIAAENAKLELIDCIFSPSFEVSKSLRNAGIPAKKIITTSYGLRESDICTHEDIAMRTQKTQPTALFVGRIGIRKGVHLLLEYWVKSGVRGKLKLVGNIEPDILPLIECYFKRSDIEHIRFTEDLRSIFFDADVFLFPSLEEGSPLVTYLALGAGLSCLVSPMGGGGIIQHDQEGIVVDPHNESLWIKSIRDVFSDAKLRNRFSLAAHEKAPEYLWAKVGRKRLKMLRRCIKNR